MTNKPAWIETATAGNTDPLPILGGGTGTVTVPYSDILRKYQDLAGRIIRPSQEIPVVHDYVVHWFHSASGSHHQGCDSDEEAMRKANDLMQDAGVVQVVVYQLGVKWSRKWAREE